MQAALFRGSTSVTAQGPPQVLAWVTSASSASALLCCGCRTCSCCRWALCLSQELLPAVVTFAYQEVAFGVGGIYFHLSTVPAKFDLYLSLSACFSVQSPVHPFVEPSGLLFSCLSWLFVLTLELCQKHEYSWHC